MFQPAPISSCMKVSVLIITYNHEKFIAQAIDSILIQQTNFDYEIVIGEDCSTDRTRDIVISYKKNYPDKIKLLLPEQNLGMQKNFIQTFMSCKGEYIACLEGDDYWTDAYKLQKQVDFLESHSETVLCYGNLVVLHENNAATAEHFFMTEPKSNFSRQFPKAITTIEDIIEVNFIPTASVLFRSGLLGTLPEWMVQVPYADWPLFTLIAEHGNLAYLNEVYGVHRVHAKGVHSSLSSLDNLKNSVYISEILNQHFNFKYNKKLEKIQILWCYLIMEILVKEKKYKEARSYIKKIIKIYWCNKNIFKLFKFLSSKTYLKIHFPSLYIFANKFKNQYFSRKIQE